MLCQHSHTFLLVTLYKCPWCASRVQGVHYGVFPGSRTSSVLRTLWFVHRPHNWHPNTSEEWLREVDVETGVRQAEDDCMLC